MGWQLHKNRLSKSHNKITMINVDVGIPTSQIILDMESLSATISFLYALAPSADGEKKLSPGAMRIITNISKLEPPVILTEARSFSSTKDYVLENFVENFPKIIPLLDPKREQGLEKLYNETLSLIYKQTVEDNEETLKQSEEELQYLQSAPLPPSALKQSGTRASDGRGLTINEDNNESYVFAGRTGAKLADKVPSSPKPKPN